MKLAQITPYIVSGLILIAAGYASTLLLGSALAPPPHEVAQALIRIGWEGTLARELSITIFRAAGGLLLANLFGVLLGLCAGGIPFLCRVTAPIVTALQACPIVVWISLALVWVGTGSAVPLAAVFIATLPPVFTGVTQGMSAVDKRALAMSRLYNVPLPVRLRQLLVPSIAPFWLAAFSHTLAGSWKVAAMAEFLGSSNGVGTRIFWSYRHMEMAELFAWTCAIILLGVGFDYALAEPLQNVAHKLKKTMTMHGKSDAVA